MREITKHHDGHGLQDRLIVYGDEAGHGGASHEYSVHLTGDGTTDPIATMSFWNGPRNEAGSVPGVTNELLLAVVADRLEGFQRSDFACAENYDALCHVEAALSALRRRADGRASRGVLGTNKP